MFDANKILGTLMESGMSRSGQSRVQRVAAGSGQSPGSGPRGHSRGSGGLGDIVHSLLGGGSGRSSGTGGGSLGGIGSLLGGRGRTGSGVSGGAMGLLGALAGAAMQHFGSAKGGQGAQGAQGAQAAGQPGLAEAPAPFASGGSADENSRAMVMIRAMIAAAKADGEIDPQEKQRILGRLEEAGADPEARAFVQDVMAKPTDLNAIVGAIDSPHTAIEAYAASLFAIDVDTPAETAHMQKLAQGLRLDPALVRELHESLEAPPPR